MSDSEIAKFAGELNANAFFELLGSISFFFFFFSKIDLLNKLYKRLQILEVLCICKLLLTHPSIFPLLFSDQIIKKIVLFLSIPDLIDLRSYFRFLDFVLLCSGFFWIFDFHITLLKKFGFFFFILWLIDCSCGRLLSLHLV